jgi:hypothetical protein
MMYCVDFTDAVVSNDEKERLFGRSNIIIEKNNFHSLLLTVK